MCGIYDIIPHINRKGNMKARDVNNKIDSLTESDWQRMKDHMDAKFPKMAMKDLESFKLLVQIFGVQMEDKEKELN